jgi:hypothetical protein
MQKFTIFTIIFSVLIITITAELVVQDYLQKLYPNPEALQSNALNANNFEDYLDTNTDEPENLKSRVEELLDSEPTDDEQEDSVSPLQELSNELNQTDSEQDLLPSAVSVRVETLLPALDIDSVQYAEKEYLNKLFQLIDTTKMPIDRSAYGLFTVNGTTIGSVYEYRGKTELDAEAIYSQIKADSDAYPEITVNETNQFGESSFYINHIVKVGEVFVVFQKDNYVYAFAYKKDLHDKFREFFASF